MRLELASYDTKDVRFGAMTRWRDGVLDVARDELLNVVRQDPLVARADVQIARPGESVRIALPRDIIEPRVKVEGPGVAYPGVLGRPVDTVGTGRTNRLSGMTLMAVAARQDSPRRRGYIASGPSKTAYNNYLEFLDMSGPGAITPWGRTCNLCLVIEPAAHLDRDAGNRVIQGALLRAQDYVAQATVGQRPAEVETFDMTPKAGLPGLVWIHSIVSPEAGTRNPESTLGTAVYGLTRLTQPWYLQPTEVLDGACFGAYMGWVTWPITSTIALHMCRAHGKGFNFLGAIMVRTMWEEQRLKQLMGNRAALVAKTLGAEGAVVTPTLRGQRFLDTVMVVQACEQAGIKSVLITEEEDDEDGYAPPMLVSGPELQCVVSTGDGSAPGPFPPVKTVIAAGTPGPEWYGEQDPPQGRYGTSHMYDVLGFSNWACVGY